ncbi:MAG: Membrane protease subunit, stomatin/prohibitin s [Myxococcales bacterium]|nr:Membrane protease subunit, stomatin/prohibitin s [Myxococcales bacterium]
MKMVFGKLGSGLRRLGVLLRAAGWASLLGIIEIVQSKRGRRMLALVTLAAITVGMITARPIRSISPGEAAVRVNRMTGAVTVLQEGWVFVLPLVHEFRTYPLRDQIYSPKQSARASGEAPYQSLEGLSIGVDVSVRWAIDPEHMTATARMMPGELTRELVVPAADGILHKTFAQHTVREIFATKRGEIQKSIEDELRAAIKNDGVLIRSVAIGNVDLPAQYRAGLEALLNEELSSDKMRFTLELKEKMIKQTELEAEADKVRREKAAEAAGAEEVIAAKSKSEAMQHILPLKEKEIEQRRLEAEAGKIVRIKEAEGNADARRIEAGGEADSRKKLADSDAYRLEVTGKATSEQMAREAALIAKNPLLIQKTLADKLSDKIQVVIAPPEAGFFAAGLLGHTPAQAPAPAAHGEE